MQGVRRIDLLRSLHLRLWTRSRDHKERCSMEALRESKCCVDSQFLRYIYIAWYYAATALTLPHESDASCCWPKRHFPRGLTGE